MDIIDLESSNIMHLPVESILLSEPLLTTQKTHDTTTAASRSGTSQGGALSTVFHMLLASAGFLLVSSLVVALGPSTSMIQHPSHNVIDGIFLLNDTISSSWNNNDDDNTTTRKNYYSDDDNTRFEVLVELFRDKHVSEEKVLRDKRTPQHAALNWLANGDDAMLDLDTTPDDILIERFVVVLLYVTTTGWAWSHPMRFLRETGVCDWYSGRNDRGILCNEDQSSITEINMAGNNLDGILPSEISLLSNLRVLQLQDNFLEGTIPEEISTLGGSLKELNLAYNMFQGTVPAALIKLSNLDTMFLQGNDLTGSLDHGICHAAREGSPISEFLADCGGTTAKIDCICCTGCCDRDDCDFQEQQFVASASLV